MATERQTVTPPELARELGVSPDKIVRWILAGELQAFNAATTASGRPRYLIDREAIEAFKRRRSVCAPPPATRRKRSNKPEREYV